MADEQIGCDTPKMARRRRRPDWYDLRTDIREMARTLGFLAALAGLIMGDIWLAGKL